MYSKLGKGKVTWCPAALKLLVPTTNLAVAGAVLVDTLTCDEEFAQNS